jgi:crotonobetainyl-CoA:carnitine CoA-transferase CaiB-like acyl-CoA transferase
VVPSGTFATSDGKYVVIGGNGDSVYSRLMTAIGRPDMAADNPKYATNTARVECEAEIMGEIEAWTKQHRLEQVMAAMKEARVPSGELQGKETAIYQETKNNYIYKKQK